MEKGHEQVDNWWEALSKYAYKIKGKLIYGSESMSP